MAYEYFPTAEELRAEELLKRKGWNVSRPTCPFCHGWGYVSDYSSFDLGDNITSVSYSQKKCPNGCAELVMVWY